MRSFSNFRHSVKACLKMWYFPRVLYTINVGETYDRSRDYVLIETNTTNNCHTALFLTTGKIQSANNITDHTWPDVVQSLLKLWCGPKIQTNVGFCQEQELASMKLTAVRTNWSGACFDNWAPSNIVMILSRVNRFEPNVSHARYNCIRP